MSIDARAFPPDLPWSSAPPSYDATIDISDMWDDEFDLNGEGPSVTALFSAAEHEDTIMHGLGHGRFTEIPYTYTLHYLIGAMVEEKGDIRFIDRDACVSVFGEGRVYDIEEMKDRLVNHD